MIAMGYEISLDLGNDGAPIDVVIISTEDYKTNRRLYVQMENGDCRWVHIIRSLGTVDYIPRYLAH